MAKRCWQSYTLVAWLLLWLLLCVLLCFRDGYGQIRDRAGVRYAARGQMAEPTTTYLPDSVLNTFANVAHRVTLQILGQETLAGKDTVIVSPSVTTYKIGTDINSDCANVTGVVLRKTTVQGGGEVALADIPPELLGKFGAGQAPAFYYQTGAFLVLGQSPEGGETLFVFYVPFARNLDVDTTQLQVGTEDHQAVVWLTEVQMAWRDRQFELADRIYTLWEFYMRQRLGTQAAPTAPK